MPWRSLATLLWTGSRWRLLLFTIAVVAVGLLPTAVMLQAGLLVEIISSAGNAVLVGGADASVIRAIATLFALLVASGLASVALWPLARSLDSRLSLNIYRILAETMFHAPTVAHLHDAAVADRIHAIQDADRRGAMTRICMHLALVTVRRLQGFGPLCVLTAFRWWAPVLIGVSWQLVNSIFVKATKHGIDTDVRRDATYQRRADYYQTLVMGSAAAKEIRVFGLGEWLVNWYTAAWREALGQMWDRRRADLRLTVGAVLLLLGCHCVVLGTLMMDALSGGVGLGALVVFVQAVVGASALGMIGETQWWLQQSGGAIRHVTALAEEVRSDLHLAVLPSYDTETRDEELRIEDVTFTYTGCAVPILSGLTLSVPRGQSIAIVGRNGAGKSTLVSLLCGFHVPDSGRVLVAGTTPIQARGHIAVILQEFVRFQLSLRDSIAFGHLPLMDRDEELRAALAAAGGADILERLPNGLDTVLSRQVEGGTDLSGGEWQKVALARGIAAIRGGARVLLLDEPTSSLDVKDEAALFDTVLALAPNVTVVLVSHRLSTVRRVDRIVVLDGGRIVEDGSHRALMCAGGLYADMFSRQAERFDNPSVNLSGSLHA